MQSDEFIKSTAALLAWREENSNGLNGMLAVILLLRNRVRAGKAKGFPDSWMGNITQKNAFSSMTVIGDGQTVKYPDPRDPVFVRLLQEVDGIYDNTTADNLTHGALYYADLSSPAYKPGNWFDRNIVQNPARFPRVTTVGTTTYFADLGALPANEGANPPGPKYL